jgi:CheY-like chemotaxis protein
VILLDLKLPRINGLELLEQIRADPALKSIPVVCLSSSREDRDLRSAYDLGANGYVVKTIDYHEYNAALKAVGLFWAIANEGPPGCIPKPQLFEPKDRTE